MKGTAPTKSLNPNPTSSSMRPSTNGPNGVSRRTSQNKTSTPMRMSLK